MTLALAISASVTKGVASLFVDLVYAGALMGLFYGAMLAGCVLVLLLVAGPVAALVIWIRKQSPRRGSVQELKAVLTRLRTEKERADYGRARNSGPSMSRVLGLLAVYALVSKGFLFAVVGPLGGYPTGRDGRVVISSLVGGELGAAATLFLVGAIGAGVVAFAARKRPIRLPGLKTGTALTLGFAGLVLSGELTKRSLGVDDRSLMLGQPTEALLADAVKKANQGLPKMIDKFTRLDTVTTPEPNVLQNNYTLLLNVDDPRVDIFRNEAAPRVIALACSTQSVARLLNLGIANVYTYRTPDGSFSGFFRVTKSDCPRQGDRP
jgi:hypothetical protein